MAMAACQYRMCRHSQGMLWCLGSGADCVCTVGECKLDRRSDAYAGPYRWPALNNNTKHQKNLSA